MLWIPTAKTTRSGRIFASFLQTTTFSIHGPLALAVSAESDKQQDHETDDDLDALDELPPEPNLLDDLDEPLPDPLPQPRKRKRSLPPDFTLPPPPKGPQSGAHRRRQRKREEKTAREGHQARTSTYTKYVAPAAPVETSIQLVSLPAANGAWVATGESAGEVRGGKKPRTVMDFLKMGFTNVCWDGKTARPLVDKHGRVFAVLAGQPDGQHYADAVRRMYDAMVRASAEARFRSDFKKHRRGLYAAVTVGFSYGQGQTVPGWLQRPHCEVGEALLENPDVQKVASFASAAFALWAPRLYQYYRKYNADLPGRRPFRTSVFSSAAFNFGPNAWTFKHRDVLNLPFGWCAIQALGRFDPTKGGHLVLWDLKLIIEFPPGALILIPSATLAHSNIPVQKGDERASFTQFTAGGLFRWVDYGFRSEDAFSAAAPEKYAEMLAGKEARWEMGLGLWSTIEELARLAEGE